jgi:hypothetical protein
VVYSGNEHIMNYLIIIYFNLMSKKGKKGKGKGGSGVI